MLCENIEGLWCETDRGWNDNGEIPNDLLVILGQWVTNHNPQNQLRTFKCWLSWYYRNKTLFQNVLVLAEVIDSQAQFSVEEFNRIFSLHSAKRSPTQGGTPLNGASRVQDG